MTRLAHMSSSAICSVICTTANKLPTVLCGAKIDVCLGITHSKLLVAVKSIDIDKRVHDYLLSKRLAHTYYLHYRTVHATSASLFLQRLLRTQNVLNAADSALVPCGASRTFSCHVLPLSAPRP
jgi:hypothetical protein